MRYFSITHTHAHGHDTHLVKCEGDFLDAFNSTTEETEFLDKHTIINFEPELGEEILIDEINLDDIPLVIL